MLVSKLLRPLFILAGLHDLIQAGVVVHQVGHAQDAEIRDIAGQAAGVGDSQDRRPLERLLDHVVGIAQGGTEEQFGSEVAICSSGQLFRYGNQGLRLEIGFALGISEADGNLFCGRRLCGALASCTGCSTGRGGAAGAARAAACSQGCSHSKGKSECEYFFHGYSPPSFCFVQINGPLRPL